MTNIRHNYIKLLSPGKDSTIKIQEKILVIRICSEDGCNFKGITYEPPGLVQGHHSHYCSKHNLRIKKSPPTPRNSPSPPREKESP